MTDGGNDLDALMKAHQAAQEKVAEDMLSLTGLLKEQAIAAGEIVRKDTAVSTHWIVSLYLYQGVDPNTDPTTTIRCCLLPSPISGTSSYTY